MSTTEQYDCVVIGAGQAGTPLSGSLAQAGLRTALIEAEHLGGTWMHADQDDGRRRKREIVSSFRAGCRIGLSRPPT